MATTRIKLSSIHPSVDSDLKCNAPVERDFDVGAELQPEGWGGGEVSIQSSLDLLALKKTKKDSNRRLQSANKSHSVRRRFCRRNPAMSAPTKPTRRIVSRKPSWPVAEHHGSCSGASEAKTRTRWNAPIRGMRCRIVKIFGPWSAPTACGLSAIGARPGGPAKSG